MALTEARTEEGECGLRVVVENLEIRSALAREEWACEAAMESVVLFEGDTIVSVVHKMYRGTYFHRSPMLDQTC